MVAFVVLNEVLVFVLYVIMKSGVSVLLCLYTIVTLRKNRANGNIIKGISTSFIWRGFFLLLFCKPWSLPEFGFRALLTDVCVGQGSERGWDFSSPLVQKVLDGIRERRLS